MSDKIYIGVDDKRVEAKGEQLQYILQAQAEAQEQARLIEAEQTKKDADRASAMAKLSKLGLTDDEIASLIP
jgi:regulator of protease activity HflC (stomatin/prohibitin superfamily)